MAPAVNRQPGHRRTPRRAPCTRKNAQVQSRLLLRALLEKHHIYISRCQRDVGSSKCFDSKTVSKELSCPKNEVQILMLRVKICFLKMNHIVTRSWYFAFNSSCRAATEL
eukprot:3260558-Pyramimonas_sp.AAC.1